jgi:hypothetical protein
MIISYRKAKEMIKEYVFIAICHYGSDASRLRKDINWQIVHLSHSIYTEKNEHGHKVREKVRANLWKFVEYEYPIVRKTK